VSLSKAQRKFAHNQAQRMGMKSKSVGKEGVNRHLTVHQEPKGDERPSSEVHIHPSSVNSRTLDFMPFLVYLEKVKTTRVFIRDCTPVSAYPIILFGGRLILNQGSSVGKFLQSRHRSHFIQVVVDTFSLCRSWLLGDSDGRRGQLDHIRYA
jgi:hypothetical protein